MLTLFGSPNTRTVRALWTLEETALPYEYRRLDLRGGECRQPEYLAINPNGKVPALQDDDLILLETNAICFYIAKAAQSPLLPECPKAQAKLMQWSDFALSELEVAPWGLIKNERIYPDGLKLEMAPLKRTMGWEGMRAQQILLKGISSSGYLLESGFSLADIHNCVALMMHFKVGLQVMPELMDYLKRCIDRPAIGRMVEMGEIAPISL